MVEFKVDYPGNFVLVDHALARVDRGVWGALHVEGEADPTIYNGQIESGNGHSVKVTSNYESLRHLLSPGGRRSHLRGVICPS